MTTDLGDVYTTGFEVRADPVYPAATGVLTTPATKVCTILLPDGTTATPTLTVLATGVLKLSFPTTVEGLHRGKVVTTTPDSEQPFTFQVGPAYSLGIVSLDDVKAHLKITSTTHDEKLRRYIDAATDFIESRVGGVVRRTITETVTPAANGTLFLSSPVISLTTMTDTYGYGWTYSVANYLADSSGMVTPLANVSRSGYPVTVTYVGGRAIVPALLQQAALDYVQWLWLDQRGPVAEPQFGAGVDDFTVTAPATVPYKILQMLEPYAAPAIA